MFFFYYLFLFILRIQTVDIDELSLNVLRVALLFVSQWQCISYFVFYIKDGRQTTHINSSMHTFLSFFLSFPLSLSPIPFT